MPPLASSTTRPGARPPWLLGKRTQVRINNASSAQSARWSLGTRDDSIRTFLIYCTYGVYGIYGRPLEAMYATRTRMSALEGCLAALRCGASARRASSCARRMHGPRRHSFVEHGRR
eukprot:359506-Chlamydomonas_euryale.AAC.3